MIKGCGWVKDEACGCVEKRRQWQYTDLRPLYKQLLKDSVLAYQIENFGRFDQASKLAALSIALALYDANAGYAQDRKQDIGILGTSADGALDPNLAYFRDYVKAGRKLGRGNLFIYTLPSSPLAESAIHFGFQGPLLYMRHSDMPEEQLLAQAEIFIKNKEARSMLAVTFDPGMAVCRFVSGEGL